MIVVFGNSGHAKEIAFILKSIGKNVSFFVVKEHEPHHPNLNIILESVLFEKKEYTETHIEIYVAIGDPVARRKVVGRIKEKLKNVSFPNLFHNTFVCDDLSSKIRLGEGNIFFPGTILTTNISIGNHNHFNLKTSVNHDCIVGDFNTFSPGTCIAGNVKIGDSNFFGVNTSVIDRLNIADDSVFGAGSVIVKDIVQAGVYVGVPANKIK